ncbi:MULTISPECIES: PadR family transcriptional regulator [Cohaesibacter]|uniref:PadR family transcriptional regulator n=1 Tax=Cohaesibacter TaxID=655352 RepID=UPI000DEAFFF6|nr:MULTISPECIES: PadR family transcriptional regulator [Cohaesibacter]TLP43375.1 PadR family transcriptional regulator [Cohaesibacter sp. CAU 1516]
MNVRSICLAILFCGDKTGYDIRKFSTEGDFSFFVEASYGSIYPALNRLEAEGLVTCRHETQDGKPARKVYSITDAGRAALLIELMQPHKPDIYRSEFLMISLFAGVMKPQDVEAAVARQIVHLEDEMGLIDACTSPERQQTEGNLDVEQSEVFENAGNWARDYGRACLQSAIDYLKTHGVELVALAEEGQAANLVSSEQQAS